MHTLGLMRVRATLSFDGALEMLRGRPDPNLQRFIFQEASRELTENDQTALRALSFFAPSATFEAWLEVAQLSRNVLETTIDRLGTLSLVDVLTGAERYALHPLTRSFVQDQLLGDAQIALEMGRRFAEYWETFARQYGGENKESYKTFDRLEAEWANLDAAVEWLWQKLALRDNTVGDKDAARVLKNLTYALWHFLFSSGRWEEAMQLNTRAYQAVEALKDWNNMGGLSFYIYVIHRSRGQIDNAAFWANRCTEAWAQGGNKRQQGYGTRMLGEIAHLQKDYDKAEKLYHKALETWRELGLEEEVVMALYHLGELARDSAGEPTGDSEKYDEAKVRYLDALEKAKKTDRKDGEAMIYGALGTLAFKRDRPVEARGWFESELSLAREIGEQYLVAGAQYGLARLHEAEGETELALSLAQEALMTFERLQHKDLAATRELVERLGDKVSKLDATDKEN
jgi:tetratricopeptide (TPR) repeat protein